jgi:DNA-binding NtrC family response regulator
VVLANERHILCEHVMLPDAAGDDEPADTRTSDTEAVSFRQGRSMVVEEFERAYVTRLIEKHGGNVTRAAREAQKDRRAFGRLLKKHGIRAGVSSSTG